MAKKNKVKPKESTQKSSDLKITLSMILGVLTAFCAVTAVLIHFYVLFIMEGIYSDFSNDTARGISVLLLILFFVFGFAWVGITSSIKD